MNYDDFFKAAAGQHAEPYGFQRKFATAKPMYDLARVPTGLGKTAMVILGWLWRRLKNKELRAETPRRLVYCLPMRVLVEQTKRCAEEWISRLYESGTIAERVPVYTLMGGEDEDEWDLYPEQDAIVVGTQDMLLSKALNRGYAVSRSRWPLQFGMLNEDCLWVYDEIQLMGNGLATTAQLDAFRRNLNGSGQSGCRSVWMSATLDRQWLATVDFRAYLDGLGELTLSDADLRHEEVARRWNARKTLRKAQGCIGEFKALAHELLEVHSPGTRTIVVLNTVERVLQLFEQVHKLTRSGAGGPRVVLLHSRFRPKDRNDAADLALAEPPPAGTLVISTQVIEAGVDISAARLFTELAPWPSMVQRFGRCNRDGRLDDAAVYWIDGPPAVTPKKREQLAAPYAPEDLDAARERLLPLHDVGLHSLPEQVPPFEHGHVLRRSDLIGLFDTTPDLAGNDTDIDRFVRETDNTDVRVFWRAVDDTQDTLQEPAPRREELCPVPVQGFREFIKHGRRAWRWDFLAGSWQRIRSESIAPGQVYLLPASAGGYTPQRGWNPKDGRPVAALPPAAELQLDANGTDPLSIGAWRTLAEHTDAVCTQLEAIIAGLGEVLDPAFVAALRLAARWHDAGKSHTVFQQALPDDPPVAGAIWAKAPGRLQPYARRHFRHELASALAVLQRPHEALQNLRDDQLNLVAYLVAAHHGKVRLSIRSFPEEQPPGVAEQHVPDSGGRRFARGVWDGDTLPAANLGADISMPPVQLSLEPMELGLCETPPFAGQPSWAERMLLLRDRLGPFRLAYLEAVLRAADMRASRAETAQTRERHRDQTNPHGERTAAAGCAPAEQDQHTEGAKAS